MSFTSLAFLVFLPSFLPLYFLTKGRGRLALCLVHYRKVSAANTREE